MIVCDHGGYAITKPNEGTRVHILPYPNAIYRIIVRGNQTNDKFTIIEGLVYAGEGAGNHIHANEDETFFIVNGTMQFYVNGDQFCASAGTTVYIPRNATQSVRNVNSKPVHIQITFAPSSIEKYLEEITPIYDTQPVNTTEATQIALKYGITNLDPVNWTDLGCVSDCSIYIKPSIYLLVLFLLFQNN